MSLNSRFAAIVLAVTAATGGAFYGVQAAGYQQLSGPYVHNNLSVVFIHGEDAAGGYKLLTLSEALISGKVEVIETGSVGELEVENLGDEPIFIQAGDIVKGGRQDRVLQLDIVLYPHSGRVPIKSFCVEQGRWSARGEESSINFESSENALASRELKLAAKSSASQGEVWSKVAEFQGYLRNAVGDVVSNQESPTSLQLTLENDKLKAQVSMGVQTLNEALDGLDNVVGFAFAINGEINSADIYGSAELFRKMWPKLIEATVTEAVANRQDDKTFSPVTREQIGEWLASAESGKETLRDLGNKLHLRVTESDDNVAFETKLEGDSAGMIHKNVIKK